MKVKKIISFLSTGLFLLSFGSVAQMDRERGYSSANISYTSDTTLLHHIVTLDVLYGTILYQKSPSNQFNSFRYSKLGNPLQTIGLSLTGTIDADEVAHYYSTHLSYSQIIPQQFSINDSLSGKINGGFFSYNIIAYDFTPRSIFSSVLLGGGFNTGRLRVSADGYRSLRNPYFAPALFFNPRFFIKNIAISLRTEYQFDVSQKKWKPVRLSQKQERFDLENLNQSGLILNLCIGWKF